MRILTLITVIVLFSSRLFAQDLQSICAQFDVFNTEVINGKVKKADAIKRLNELTSRINQNLIVVSEVWPVNRLWVFPLQGYDYHAIGGANGNGYSDKGYHYLDGNKHLAHPAHDIFIRDKNQDCIDDRTSKPVSVLAVDAGVVVACTDQWETGSNLRGGRYIWIYHVSGVFTYYAHNSAIFVKLGARVKPGQKIAEVGRTGLNAYPKRSPTHLHFSAFHIINGLPVPFNPYTELKKATKQ